MPIGSWFQSCFFGSFLETSSLVQSVNKEGMLSPIQTVVKEETPTSIQAEEPFFSIQSKKTGLCIKLEAKPYAKTVQHIYKRTSSEQGVSSTTFLRPFADWTKEERREAVHGLINLCTFFGPYVADNKLLSKIYKLIALHQASLCQYQESAPVMFKGSIEDSKGNASLCYSLFDLEVHSSTKIYLLFLRVQSHHFINQGSFKEWYRGYSLGQDPTKIIAYGKRKPFVDLKPRQVSHIQRRMQNEAHYLTKFSDYPHIGKVNRVSHYQFTDSEAPEQIIEMEYYLKNFFGVVQALFNDRKRGSPYHQTDHERITYSIQFVELMVKLHEEEQAIHRDIKLENLVFNEKQKSLHLIDFEVACQSSASQRILKKERGSTSYLAPEILFKAEKITRATALDVWSVGCVLWIYLTIEVYPWHKIVQKDRQTAQDLMRKFDQEKPAEQFKLSYLLWNALRYDPQDRCTAQNVLTYLKQLDQEIPKGSSTYLTNMFNNEKKQMKAISAMRKLERIKKEKSI